MYSQESADSKPEDLDQTDIAPYRHRTPISQPSTPLIQSSTNSPRNSGPYTQAVENGSIPVEALNIPPPVPRRPVSIIKKGLSLSPVPVKSVSVVESPSNNDYKRLRPTSSILEEATPSSKQQPIYQSIDSPNLADQKKYSLKFEDLYSQVSKEKVAQDNLLRLSSYNQAISSTTSPSPNVRVQQPIYSYAPPPIRMKQPEQVINKSLADIVVPSPMKSTVSESKEAAVKKLAEFVLTSSETISTSELGNIKKKKEEYESESEDETENEKENVHEDRSNKNQKSAGNLFVS